MVGEIEKKLPSSVFGRWVRYMHEDGNKVDKSDRFPELLKFLIRERRSVEYTMEGIRTSQTTKSAMVHSLDVTTKSGCIIHRDGQHKTGSCRTFISKSVAEKMNILKESRACFSCLTVGHTIAKCRRKKQCGVQGCTRLHHNLLHRQEHEKVETDLTTTCRQRQTLFCCS
ncbi:uncharacterized protein LOC117124629 [Anneissia japonica]|uniref:uncharacterized protein LOC117124629 n=1 Tax=Anneissia japonica TaxID=1529436 RepID=UPI0014254F62|nr:uncharacterized protein LOC117124629 [Anneissia japonica]